MDINKFIEEINAIDWVAFGGSPFYKPEEVPKSLIALALSEYEAPIKIEHHYDTQYNTIAPTVCRNVVNAIGNDHSGSYYPAVQSALPFILVVALNGNNEFARHNAVYILYDLCFFSPEDGNIQLKEFVITSILDKRADFIELALSDKYNQDYLDEFVETLNELAEEAKDVK